MTEKHQENQLIQENQGQQPLHSSFPSRMESRKAVDKRKWIRYYALGMVYILLLLGLGFRLFHVQVLNGKEYMENVRKQQQGSFILEEKSGNITDRSGISFTSAGEALELKVFPHAIGFEEAAFDVIESLTGKTRESFDNTVNSYSLPVINPNRDMLELVNTNRYPGVLSYTREIRYDDDSLARHVVGYLRKSDGEPMSGMEKEFSSVLHPGQTSYISVFADAANRPLFRLGYQMVEPEQKWYDVRLTLDYQIQAILEETLDQYPGHRHGGLVVEAHTGKILALASRPQYKQYDPADRRTGDQVSSFLSIPTKQFPLGSVFKIIIASAALESGRYNEDSQFTCTSGIQVGDKWIACSNSGLGEITLREAFAHSCNDTFIRVAMDLGGDVIVDTAKSFGLGTEIDIELPNAKGLLMEKDDYTGPGIANLAIGQGSILVTPLQIADMLTTILNSGERKQLQLVEGFVDSSGNRIDKDHENNTQVRNPIEYNVISSQTASKLIEWMEDVTEYGTGRKANDPLIGGTAGKTGTPKVNGDPRSSEYGWFAGFYPRDHPRYVIVVLSQEEGGASQVAAPLFQNIARRIWLNKHMR